MAKQFKHSKKSRSSSLGPTTRSASKSHRGPIIDSDGFTTVSRKGDTTNATPSFAQPAPLPTAKRNQSSISSPPSSSHHAQPDMNVEHLIDNDGPPPSDHPSTTDDDYHNPEAAAHWHGFTSATTTHSISDTLRGSRPTSRQSSTGLSFSDESNRIQHHLSSTQPPQQSHSDTIDTHRFKSMEHQLATMMEYIKKSEERNNQLLLSHGIDVNHSSSSSTVPSKPTALPTQSCGTHRPSVQGQRLPHPKLVPPMVPKSSVPPAPCLSIPPLLIYKNSSN
jgi:hypothetical protein